jgi:hypothetical protein
MYVCMQGTHYVFTLKVKGINEASQQETEGVYVCIMYAYRQEVVYAYMYEYRLEVCMYEFMHTCTYVCM